MMTWRVLATPIIALSLAACSRETRPAESQPDAGSAAKKAGKAAHEIAEETEKAAKKVGSALKKAAKDAHEGWKEAEREDKAKGGK